MNFKNIPIFIISYNRTETLKKCLERYVNDGYTNIIILDNNSNNEAHLSYLKTLPYDVRFLKKNYGHHVLWECGLFEALIKNSYYVLTDPDILPVENCPDDYVEQFYHILIQNPQKTKVGFSLKLDDLPDEYKYKYDIIRLESFYWEKKIKYRFPLYDAPIDTTFALYSPCDRKHINNFYEGIRTGYPYVARHLGWYVNNFSQKDYYANGTNDFSTSMNDAAINEFRCAVISKLLMRQNKTLYPVIKAIFSTDYVKKNASWFEVLRCIAYLLVKKIAVFMKLKQ